MPTNLNPQSQLDLESKILRALCNDPSPPATRPAILASLRTHHWQDPEHRVVFEALTALPARRPQDLREQLPAQATRMGFPDVNWQKYFAADTDNAALETLVAELLAVSHEEKP
jgi:hypothetical protein